MNNHRQRQAQHPEYRRGAKGPNGRPLCRRCLGECPKRRRTFCSDECVRDFLLAKGGSADVRRYVFERDKGVCDACGLDCEKARRVLRRLAYRFEEDEAAVKAFRSEYCDAPGRPRFRTQLIESNWCTIYRVLLMRLGWSKAQAHDVGKSLWQADHIVPLVEGGGSGMDNLRTLCVPCHADETSFLAKRRKENR